MDRSEVSKLVLNTLATYRYEPPPPGSTVGVPRPAEAIYAQVERLRECLVKPYMQRFELRETYQQCEAVEPIYADYWVVAEAQGSLEWFDPDAQEFGLGERSNRTSQPISIGVRGDLVGVFCAM